MVFRPAIQAFVPSVAVPEIPGLTYLPDFLDPAEQKRTLETIGRSHWMSTLERRVQHYGWRYDYRSRVVTADMDMGALPDWLSDLARSEGGPQGRSHRPERGAGHPANVCRIRRFSRSNHTRREEKPWPKRPSRTSKPISMT